MRELWKQFWGLFQSGQRLSFPWLFLSQQGLCALPNPHVTFESCFVDDFWVYNDSVSVDYFWVHRGCVRSVIHSSPVKAVSLTISESSATQISLSISDWTRALCADEFKSYLLKWFRWYFWFCSDSVFVDYFWVNSGFVCWQIHALLVEAVLMTICESSATQFSLTISESTEALCSAESKHHLWMLFRWWFLSRQRLRFCWLFLIHQGLWALTNPHVTCGSGFVHDFWVGSDLVFVDYFWVNLGYVRLRIHTSLVEAVSLMISESTSVVRAAESMHQLW